MAYFAYRPGRAISALAEMGFRGRVVPQRRAPRGPESPTPHGDRLAITPPKIATWRDEHLAVTIRV